MFLIKINCSRCSRKSSFFISSNIELQIRCESCNTLLAEIEETSGFVYILSNPSMPGLVKIGLTSRNVTDRVAELNSATGVPTSFAVEAYFVSLNLLVDEKAIHARLSSRRMKGREFFRCSVEEAIKIATEVLRKSPAYCTGKYTKSEQKNTMSGQNTDYSPIATRNRTERLKKKYSERYSEKIISSEVQSEVQKPEIYNPQYLKTMNREDLKEGIKHFFRCTDGKSLVECPFCTLKLQAHKLLQHCDSQHSSLFLQRQTKTDN